MNGVQPRAEFWQRVVAALIDGFGISIVYFIFSQISFYLGMIVWVLSLGYYTYFHGTPSGQTVGKKLMNIRVVDFESGGPIDYTRSFIRWIGTAVSGIPCGLGYLWMLWDADKQTWHDKFARTTVVPTSDFPVEKWPG